MKIKSNPIAAFLLSSQVRQRIVRPKKGKGSTSRKPKYSEI